MLDSRGFIHVPRHIRIAVLVILASALALAIAVTAYYVKLDNPADPKFSDWILVGMSLVHLALTGFAAALLLFYTEKEVGTTELLKKTDHFLDVSVTETLAKASPSYATRLEGCTVRKLGRSDIFGAAYELSQGNSKLNVWIGVNVSRLIVIYWFDDSVVEKQTLANRLKEVFQFTFGGAEKVGFSTFFEPATVKADKHIVSVWSSIKLQHNLLLEPSERLFWLQDITMMTESLWRTAIRENIAFSTETPSPL
jgi:hypothetical protein